MLRLLEKNNLADEEQSLPTAKWSGSDPLGSVVPRGALSLSPPAPCPWRAQAAGALQGL